MVALLCLTILSWWWLAMLNHGDETWWLYRSNHGFSRWWHLMMSDHGGFGVNQCIWPLRVGWLCWSNHNRGLRELDLSYNVNFIMIKYLNKTIEHIVNPYKGALFVTSTWYTLHFILVNSHSFIINDVLEIYKLYLTIHMKWCGRG